jgi:hypothetical protein
MTRVAVRITCLLPLWIHVEVGLCFNPCRGINLTLNSSKKSNSGGQATEGRDSAGGVAKAKKEHPEAPDPAIGMQDERGGRGG